MSTSQKVSTCLWFDGQAEAAATLYTGLFGNSRITNVFRYGPGAPMPDGTAIMVTFELDGVRYSGLNGGPQFPLTEAVSLIVNCDTQQEIDRLWSALIADGGRESQCFWLKDRFGLSWQIVPAKLGTWMSGADKDAAGRVMAVVMSSVKADLVALENAYNGK